MEELEAINIMLQAIGNRPVSTLEGTNARVAAARLVLNRIVKREQTEGYWFNRLYNNTYYPNVEGKIVLPSNVIKIEPADSKIILRGNTLFDSYNNTEIFTCPQCILKETRLMEWDEIGSYSYKSYCLSLAAADFVRDEIEDQNKENTFRQEASREMLRLNKEQITHLDLNIFNKPRIARARHGIRPYRTHSTYDKTNR